MNFTKICIPDKKSLRLETISDYQESNYRAIVKKKDVIVGINSTFSADAICTSEPIMKISNGCRDKNTSRMARSTTDTTDLTRVSSSDSGGVSLGDPTYSGIKTQSDFGLVKKCLSAASIGASSRELELNLENESIENFYTPDYSNEYYIMRKDSTKIKAQFGDIVREFYWKEVVFTRDLQLINDTFFNLVKEHVLKFKILKEIFGSFRQLTPIYDNFVSQLKEKLNEPEEKMVSEVGSLILGVVHNLLKIYESFVMDFATYIIALDTLTVSDIAFRTDIMKFDALKECYIPINWLLLKLLNRPFSWQPMVAKMIEIQLSECGNSTISQYQVAMDKLMDLAKKTKSTRSYLEEVVTSLQLERDIGLAGVLTKPGRKILRYGFVLRSAKRAPCSRIMILCTDRILFGHRGLNMDGSFFTIHAEITLKGLMVEEGDTYHVMEGEENVITLHNANKSIVFAAPDRESWLEDITEAIKTATKNKGELHTLVKEKKDENDIDISKAFMSDESPTTKLSPLQVAWYRKCSFGRIDMSKMVSNTMCGYLKRKLRNSAGWQELWVVMCCHTLFFYRNHKEKEPLAHLSLLNYGIGLPNALDNIPSENCFKLFYGSHQYFFRAENHHFFERWVDSIFQCAISKDSLDVVTALALRI